MELQSCADNQIRQGYVEIVNSKKDEQNNDDPEQKYYRQSSVISCYCGRS